MTSLETVLRLCETAEPNPWYPRTYCQERQVARESIDPALDQLRLGGLIELTPWVADRGQGYRLTAAGRAALASPRSVERLSEGIVPAAPKPLPRSDGYVRPANTERWLQVESAFHADRPAMMSMVPAVLCVGFFLWGLMLASRAHVQSAFLAGFMGGDHTKYEPILDETGSVTFPYLVAGQWWRLLTANFVHAGMLHLAMNMYALYILGPLTERMFGRWRFLLICLTAALGSSTVGVYFQNACVGFSGVDCGLLGAILGWSVLNRRYFPRRAYSMQMSWLIQNIVLLTLISFAPGVSWSGHLGGAVLGFLAGGVLTWNRFGSLAVKIPTVLAAAALPVLCVVGFKPMAERAGKWQIWQQRYDNFVREQERVTEAREHDAFIGLQHPVIDNLNAAENAIPQSKIEDMLLKPSPGDVKKTAETLREKINILAADEKKLSGAEEYRDAELNAKKAALLELVEARIALYEFERDTLEEGLNDAKRMELADLKERAQKANGHWNDLVKNKASD